MLRFRKTATINLDLLEPLYIQIILWKWDCGQEQHLLNVKNVPLRVFIVLCYFWQLMGFGAFGLCLSLSNCQTIRLLPLMSDYWKKTQHIRQLNDKS